MPYNHLILDLVLDVVRLDLEALHILPLGLVPGLDGLVFLILPPCSPRVCLFLIKYASLISASKYEKRKWTTLGGRYLLLRVGSTNACSVCGNY